MQSLYHSPRWRFHRPRSSCAPQLGFRRMRAHREPRRWPGYRRRWQPDSRLFCKTRYLRLSCEVSVLVEGREVRMRRRQGDVLRGSCCKTIQGVGRGVGFMAFRTETECVLGIDIRVVSGSGRVAEKERGGTCQQKRAKKARAKSQKGAPYPGTFLVLRYNLRVQHGHAWWRPQPS